MFNEYEYKENISASFGQLSGNINKWNYKIGARLEFTKNNGKSILTNQELVDSNYLNFFPNFQLGYSIDSDLILGATFSRRINRPTFQDLNPFIEFIDSFSVFKGNPGLRPSISYQSELSLIYDDFATITLGYTREKDHMNMIVNKDEQSEVFTAKTMNLESNETYSLNLVLPYEFSWWTTVNTIVLYKSFFKYKDKGVLVQNSNPSQYLRLYNEFRISDFFSLELTYDYLSSGSDGIFLTRPYQSLGACLSRKFLDDKLYIGISAFDIMFREIESGTTTFGDNFIDFSSKRDSRIFQLTLTWGFGKLKDFAVKGNEVSGEENDRIKKD